MNHNIKENKKINILNKNNNKNKKNIDTSAGYSFMNHFMLNASRIFAFKTHEI